MDEGVWLNVSELDVWFFENKLSLVLLYDWFGFEEDAGKIRIYHIKQRNEASGAFLEWFGYKFDDVEPPKRLPSQKFEAADRRCMCCYSTCLCLNFRPNEATGIIQLCTSCLGEMLAFLEMAEERDSGAKEVTNIDWKTVMGFGPVTDQGIVRTDRVP